MQRLFHEQGIFHMFTISIEISPKQHNIARRCLRTARSTNPAASSRYCWFAKWLKKCSILSVHLSHAYCLLKNRNSLETSNIFDT